MYDVWTIGDWDDIETSLLEDIAKGAFKMYQPYYTGKTKQCQVCRSMDTDGRLDVEDDTIAICNECADRTVNLSHEGAYVIREGRTTGKTYAWPLNKKRPRR